MQPELLLVALKRPRPDFIRGGFEPPVFVRGERDLPVWREQAGVLALPNPFR
jgi:hypothetical protein